MHSSRCSRLMLLPAVLIRPWVRSAQPAARFVALGHSVTRQGWFHNCLAMPAASTRRQAPVPLLRASFVQLAATVVRLRRRRHRARGGVSTTVPAPLAPTRVCHVLRAPLGRSKQRRYAVACAIPGRGVRPPPQTPPQRPAPLVATARSRALPPPTARRFAGLAAGVGWRPAVRRSAVLGVSGPRQG